MDNLYGPAEKSVATPQTRGDKKNDGEGVSAGSVFPKKGNDEFVEQVLSDPVLHDIGDGHGVHVPSTEDMLTGESLPPSLAQKNEDLQQRNDRLTQDVQRNKSLVHQLTQECSGLLKQLRTIEAKLHRQKEQDEARKEQYEVRSNKLWQQLQNSQAELHGQREQYEARLNGLLEQIQNSQAAMRAQREQYEARLNQQQHDDHLLRSSNETAGSMRTHLLVQKMDQMERLVGQMKKENERLKNELQVKDRQLKEKEVEMKLFEKDYKEKVKHCERLEEDKQRLIRQAVGAQKEAFLTKKELLLLKRQLESLTQSNFSGEVSGYLVESPSSSQHSGSEDSSDDERYEDALE